eukprot:CAMPEP_0172553312 /NCGR_PEP_ID=MMETSP1067-20121228/50006_1 /TAXON_ID=265564 ORGANISM="Thalassiosira punctigera, Strain Tpunct2005C2" /NCGR_SAMPLE_ID=MMETSP1067 /ASSEMBLY_ACC=CAM_ASM_000444 /LENGTH=644 /DNA_ID=CAMNT_0013341477 /DNA_START=250 /DNA_END=2184 /DNA_ORIENTATION=+
MTASLPRVLIILSIVAAGCIISSLLFLSTEITSPHRLNDLRLEAAADAHVKIRGNRRHLSLIGFNDPKTVELRPIQVAQTDAVTAEDANKIKLKLNAPPPEQIDSNAINDINDAQPPIIVDDSHVVDGPFHGNDNENNNKNINNGNDSNNNNNAIAVHPYNIDSALLVVRAFRYTLFFFVYDSASDAFVIVHNVPGCDYGCARIYRVASVASLALRKNFPSFFRGPESEDFVVMISCGDAPRIKKECLRPANKLVGSKAGGPYACGSAEFGPILQFGSTFVDPEYFPSMIVMPQAVRPHIPCFDEWQATEGRNGVCQDLRPKVDFSTSSIKEGMVFGEELGLVGEGYWDRLIPQIIWRGTDFVFLHTMFPNLRAPSYKLDIEPKQKSFPKGGTPEDDKRWAIKTLWEMGDDKLLPRWRGVLLTSEAELEASEHAAKTGEATLPWVNIKFANVNVNGIKVPAGENEEYLHLSKLGIAAIGEHVNMTQQAKYKYHIDLGGGGGTTWTGTVEKLALPGVLFHHVTPTKDWFHDLLVPWQHYIPVKTDLSDLREKFEWAESHPVEAKQIAEQGTAFARWMGSPEGFARLYEDHLVAPLRNVLRAYRPLPPRYKGKSALEIIMESGKKKGFTIVGRCSGLHSNSCENLV